MTPGSLSASKLSFHLASKTPHPLDFSPAYWMLPHSLLPWFLFFLLIAGAPGPPRSVPALTFLGCSQLTVLKPISQAYDSQINTTTQASPRPCFVTHCRPGITTGTSKRHQRVNIPVQASVQGEIQVRHLPQHSNPPSVTGTPSFLSGPNP